MPSASGPSIGSNADGGLLYLPTYILLMTETPAIYVTRLAQGMPVSLHDAHPMERYAEIEGTGRDPWGGRGYLWWR